MPPPPSQGYGPESLLQFVAACRGLPYENGANQEVPPPRPPAPLGPVRARRPTRPPAAPQVGLQAVRVLDGLYRSAASGKTEKCK